MNNRSPWIEKRQIFYTDKTQTDSKPTFELKFISIPNSSTPAIAYDDIQIKIVMSNLFNDNKNRFCILLNLTQSMNLFYDVLFKPKEIIDGKKGVVKYNHITNNNLEFIFDKTDEIILRTMTDSTNDEIKIVLPIGTYRAIYFIISEFIKNFIMLNNTFINQDFISKILNTENSYTTFDNNSGSNQGTKSYKKKK